MLSRHLIGFAPLLLYPLRVAAQGPSWTFAWYDVSTQCSNNIADGLFETFTASSPSICSHGTNGDTDGLESIFWDSGGSADQADSYFLCLYSDDNCNDPIATLPEGPFDCMASGFPTSFETFQVFSSDSPGC